MDPSYYTIELAAHDNGWRAKLRSASGRVLAEANSRDHNDSLVETLAHQAIAAQADRHEYWSDQPPSRGPRMNTPEAAVEAAAKAVIVREAIEQHRTPREAEERYTATANATT